MFGDVFDLVKVNELKVKINLDDGVFIVEEIDLFELFDFDLFGFDFEVLDFEILDFEILEFDCLVFDV